MTQWNMARDGMLKLTSRADVYWKRMVLASQKKKEASDREDIWLFQAEYDLAEQSFVEMSKQATKFQLDLNTIAKLVRSLTTERDQLFRQIDHEMHTGRLRNDLPGGDLSDGES